LPSPAVLLAQLTNTSSSSAGSDAAGDSGALEVPPKVC
jgi:hypothetical protein